MQGIDLFRDEVAAATRRGARELQFVDQGHRLDLTWGHPDPTLLPTAEITAATEGVLGDQPWRALSYGASPGSGHLREAIAGLLGRPGRAVGPDEVIVTYGSSGALDLVLAVLATDDDVVLVEQPTYFLALRIIADRGLRVMGLPDHVAGRDVSADLAEAAVGLRRDGHAGRTFLYLCPTHANPTGRTLAPADRAALVTTARRHDVVIIEDDVYGELGEEAVAPLWSLDPENVVRLGSFSKTVAPGLRLGYLRAAPSTVARLAGCGLLDSGGGANPLVAAVMAEMIATGAYATIVARLGATYRERMAALLAPLPDAVLPAGRPTGGYFAWVASPPGQGPDDLAGAARAAGVAVAPAQPFSVDPVGRRAARVSCSLLGPVDLADAGARLARVLGGDDPGAGGPGGRS